MRLLKTLEVEKTIGSPDTLILTVGEWIDAHKGEDGYLCTDKDGREFFVTFNGVVEIDTGSEEGWVAWGICPALDDARELLDSVFDGLTST